MPEQFGQPLPALPGGNETTPVRDGEIDRRQGPRAQNRPGDNNAGRGLLVDHEPSADREDRRLQQQAQDFRRRAEPAADVAGASAGCDEITIELMPPFGNAADHTHCGDCLGVAPARFQERVTRHGKLRGAAGRMAGLDLGDDCQGDKDDGAEQRSQSDQGVKQKTDREINRHPGQIEERDWAAAGQKAAHAVEVANGLGALAFAADL